MNGASEADTLYSLDALMEDLDQPLPKNTYMVKTHTESIVINADGVDIRGGQVTFYRFHEVELPRHWWERKKMGQEKETVAYFSYCIYVGLVEADLEDGSAGYGIGNA